MPFKDSPTIVLSEAELNFAVQLAKFYQKRNIKISQIGGERAFEPIQTQTQGASFSNANTHPPSAAASSSTAAIAPRQPGRLREIKDIEPGVFCDVYGEVRPRSHRPSLSPPNPVSCTDPQMSRRRFPAPFSPPRQSLHHRLHDQSTFNVLRERFHLLPSRRTTSPSNFLIRESI